MSPPPPPILHSFWVLYDRALFLKGNFIILGTFIHIFIYKKDIKFQLLTLVLNINLRFFEAQSWLGSQKNCNFVKTWSCYTNSNSY